MHIYKTIVVSVFTPTTWKLQNNIIIWHMSISITVLVFSAKNIIYRLKIGVKWRNSNFKCFFFSRLHQWNEWNTKWGKSERWDKKLREKKEKIWSKYKQKMCNKFLIQNTWWTIKLKPYDTKLNLTYKKNYLIWFEN